MQREFLKREIDHLLTIVAYLLGVVAGIVAVSCALLIAAMFIKIPFAMGCVLQLFGATAGAVINARCAE